jgi:hypothetical protein
MGADATNRVRSVEVCLQHHIAVTDEVDFGRGFGRWLMACVVDVQVEQGGKNAYQLSQLWFCGLCSRLTH